MSRNGGSCLKLQLKFKILAAMTKKWRAAATSFPVPDAFNDVNRSAKYREIISSLFDDHGIIDIDSLSLRLPKCTGSFPRRRRILSLAAER